MPGWDAIPSSRSRPPCVLEAVLDRDSAREVHRIHFDASWQEVVSTSGHRMDRRHSTSTVVSWTSREGMDEQWFREYPRDLLPGGVDMDPMNLAGGIAVQPWRRSVEAERLAAEASEAARKAEEERLAAEAARKAEKEHLAAEATEAARKAEKERLSAQAAEAARKAEEERLAAEAEAARKAKEVARERGKTESRILSGQ